MTQNAITRKGDTQNGDSLGTRLKAAQKDASLSINGLARELDVDPRTVARWRSDEAIPSVVRLSQIAQVLDKPMSYFLEGVQEAAA